MASMPLRISAELVEKARAEADSADRSVTAQVEHWLKLGMALEDVLSHRQAMQLKRHLAVGVPEALERARSGAGQEAALAHLRESGQPRYGTDPAYPGRIIRIDPDGTRTVGSFVNRRFVPDSAVALPSRHSDER